MTYPIIILHGWTYTSERWHPVVKLLADAGLSTRLLDIPGLTTPVDRPWSLEDYINWLHQQIGDQAPVVLIGHSNGGRIALAFAVRYPELVHKLVLIDSAGIYHQELGLKIKRLVFKGLAKVGKSITKSAKLRSALYRVAGSTDYKQADPNMRQTMLNLIEQDLTRVLPDIMMPTIIIWGAEDTVTPVADAYLMHRTIPSSQLEIIKTAKHSPHITHPQVVSQFIVNFLQDDTNI